MTQIEGADAPNDNTPIWCVVANVRDAIPSGPGALETREGTRKFHAGAKVYFCDAYWGMGVEQVMVIGRYRGKRLIASTMNIRYLTNWRAQLVYHPGVITYLKEITRPRWDGGEECKALAARIAVQFNEFSDKLHNERLAKREASQSPPT